MLRIAASAASQNTTGAVQPGIWEGSQSLDNTCMAQNPEPLSQGEPMEATSICRGGNWGPERTRAGSGTLSPAADRSRFSTSESNTPSTLLHCGLSSPTIQCDTLIDQCPLDKCLLLTMVLTYTALYKVVFTIISLNLYHYNVTSYSNTNIINPIFQVQKPRHRDMYRGLDTPRGVGQGRLPRRDI